MGCLMPYRIYKSSGPRPWKIAHQHTGKVVGTSKTKANALASVRARFAGEKGKK
jgi:hypothetical protein